MIRRGASGSSADIAEAIEYLTAHFGRAEKQKLASGQTEPAQRTFLDSNPSVLQIAGQTDWRHYGHDAGGMRYSPLKQIDVTNVTRLVRAWTYNTGKTGRQFEATPLVIDNTMFLITPNEHVLALEPETGREIWNYDPRIGSGGVARGVSFWPGDRQTGPRILFGTADGRLIALDAHTGKQALEFGDNGQVNLRTGVADRFPKAQYAITSPPAIYRDLVIVGPEIQEGPSHGPSGDPRAFDVRSGKLVWTLHILPRPGEPAAETWGPDGLKDRAGPSLWGFMTIDMESGMLFLPVGNPADGMYGADRPGANLYANSVVAVRAATGEMRWHYQMVHHDTFDYDVAAPPALIDVNRDGKKIPALAEITKMGLLFILDRATGKPVFGAEERPIPSSDVPGEKSAPTQPFPLKPPALARNSVSFDELSSITAGSKQFCAELLKKYPNKGPYTPFLLNGSTVFPSTMGGGNWGGVAFDPTLHLIFVNTNNLGSIGRMVKTPETAASSGLELMPYRSEGGYARFVDQDHYPCNRPPWGELSAVNADTGEIAWRVPLGEYQELRERGIPRTGAPSVGGPIVTAGGLVFIAGTNDSRFRAFDARTGKELWTAKLDGAGQATPMTYLGRDGKQYVVIAAGAAGHLRAVRKGDEDADVLTAFALPH